MSVAAKAATPAQEPTQQDPAKPEVVPAPPAKPDEAKPAQPDPAPAPEKAAAEKDKPEEPSPSPESKKDAPPETPAVPEKYELKVPEGSQLKPEHVEAVSVYAKENGLTQKQAQALLDRDQAFYEQFDRQRRGWLDASKSDKEIGGLAFDENVKLADRALTRFAPPAFKQLLNETGLGNHPDMLRTFSKIGKLISDDKLVQPGSQGAGVGQKSLEDIFYGESQAKEA